MHSLYALQPSREECRVVSLKAIRSVVWAVVLLAASILPGPMAPLPAAGQSSSQVADPEAVPAWIGVLGEAAASNNSDVAAPLLERHRLDVGDVVSGWIRDGLRERLLASGGEPPADGNGLRQSAAPSLVRAGRVAQWYRERFQEPSLMLQVGFATELPPHAIGDKLRADSLFELGVAQRASADTREASREALLGAEALYESLGDLAGLAATKGQLGYVSWFLDRGAYLTYNQSALELRRRLGDKKLIGNTLNDIGIYYFSALGRDYKEALDALLESERIRWAIGDSIPLTRTLAIIARSFEAVGRFDEAENYYRKAGDLYLATGNTAQWIRQRNNATGILTDYLDRHSDAMVDLLALREDLRLTDDARTEALVTNQLGVVSRRLGDFESAIAYYQDVIALAEENGFDDLLAGAYNNIGVVFIWLNRPDRAEPFFERALGASSGADFADSRLNALVNLGSASFEQRSYGASLDWLSRAASLADSLSDDVTSATVKMGLGNARLRAEGPASARPAYEEALAIATEYDLPELQMGIYFGFGDAAEADGQADSAYVWYEKGVAAIESARGLLHAAEDRAGFIAQTTYLYEDYVDFLTRTATGATSGSASSGTSAARPVDRSVAVFGSAEENVWMDRAFLTAERAKARVFSEQLAEATAGVESGVDPELAEREQVMIDSLAFVRSLIPAAEDRERRAMLKDYLRDLEIRFSALEREIRAQNPAYADLVYPEPVTLREFQAALSPGQVALSYSVGDSSSALWAVSARGARLVRLPSRSELRTQVDQLRFALEDPARTTPRAYGLAAQGLYDMLVAPAADLLEDATDIIVMPHDLLNYVPFEALVSMPGDSWSSHTYFLEAGTISYMSSATAWIQMGTRPARSYTHDLLAVGNPDFGATNGLSALRNNPLEQLPFTATEIENVEAVVGPGDRSVVLSGADATEARVRAAAASDSYRFVHFATHGLIDDNRPDYSALALTRPGASTENNAVRETGPGEGLLQASEIFNLPFSSELVVLSACETGLGQLVQGEGMVGLTRAFMYAGAESVMASLWAVADESTAELMSAFYAYAAGGRQSHTTAEALRRAKLDMTSSEWAHPFHWAPFILTGRTDR